MTLSFLSVMLRVDCSQLSVPEGQYMHESTDPGIQRHTKISTSVLRDSITVIYVTSKDWRFSVSRCWGRYVLVGSQRK